jgi:DnaJ-class molecular chaperone
MEKVCKRCIGTGYIIDLNQLNLEKSLRYVLCPTCYGKCSIPFQDNNSEYCDFLLEKCIGNAD